MKNELRASILLPVVLLLLGVSVGVSGAAAQTASQKASAKKKPAVSNHSAGANSSRSSVHKASGSKGKSSSKKASRSRHKPGQTAPTPDRISEIQTALAKNHALSGEPSGKWDDSTVDAMKKFQAANGLNPSGKLDAPTLQKLGLGSQTAGVAAPLPSSRASLLTSEKNTEPLQ